jgi:hypothetical protein
MLMLLVLATSIAGAAPGADDKIGESCSGVETLRLGEQVKTDVPYALVFSADLSTRTYCYDRCGPDQTYAIAQISTNSLDLADVDRGGQVRHLVFDRRSGVLTDDQTFDSGLGRVVRHATATCRSSAFREPASLTLKTPS